MGKMIEILCVVCEDRYIAENLIPPIELGDIILEKCWNCGVERYHIVVSIQNKIYRELTEREIEEILEHIE